MRATLLLSLVSLLLSACPSAPPVEDPDILWDPPLTSEDTGTLDLGELQAAVNVEAQIGITNNTDADMALTISFSLDPNQGFWGSGLDSSQDVTLGAGADHAVPIKVNPSQPGSINSSIDFIFDNRVVSWTIVGTVVN